MKQTDFQRLQESFKALGVATQIHDERQGHWHPAAVPTAATQFISTGIAHYHFDADGAYLGTECNGDGKFVSKNDSSAVAAENTAHPDA